MLQNSFIEDGLFTNYIKMLRRKGMAEVSVSIKILNIINWSIIMRFYSNSTSSACQTEKASDHTVTIPIVTTVTNTPIEPFPTHFYYYNNYCRQFMHLSNLLNQALISNNNLINARTTALPPQGRADKETGKSETTDSNKNTSQYQEPPNQIRQPTQNEKAQKIKRRRKIHSEEEESYKPDHSDSKEVGIMHVSQSKNIPKNYGKAIVNFIQRNQQSVRKLLTKLKIDYQSFMGSLNKLKKNLNTIMQLRSLWLDEQNQYGKAYRILSMEYLRKHCLPYIFNSRVENFHKHIKYRYKMIEGVSDPQRFTHMKQF